MGVCGGEKMKKEIIGKEKGNDAKETWMKKRFTEYRGWDVKMRHEM